MEPRTRTYCRMERKKEQVPAALTTVPTLRIVGIWPTVRPCCSGKAPQHQATFSPSEKPSKNVKTHEKHNGRPVDFLRPKTIVQPFGASNLEMFCMSRSNIQRSFTNNNYSEGMLAPLDPFFATPVKCPRCSQVSVFPPLSPLKEGIPGNIFLKAPLFDPRQFKAPNKERLLFHLLRQPRPRSNKRLLAKTEKNEGKKKIQTLPWTVRRITTVSSESKKMPRTQISRKPTTKPQGSLTPTKIQMILTQLKGERSRASCILTLDRN
jgi:hypothetical protein